MSDEDNSTNTKDESELGEDVLLESDHNTDTKEEVQESDQERERR